MNCTYLEREPAPAARALATASRLLTALFLGAGPLTGVIGCAVDDREVGIGNSGAGSESTSAVSCAGRATWTCGEVYGAVGECAAIVLACSSDGFWPAAESCAPPALAGRCGSLDPNVTDCTEPGSPGCEPELNASDGGASESADAGSSSAPLQPSCPDQFISFDEVFELIEADVLATIGADRAFVRYLTLTNRYNAGVCGADLASDRLALNEIVNLLSQQQQIALPEAIDADDIIFRIDLRDYNWNRTLSVNGVNFEDAWEAIAAHNPFAIPFEGTAADSIAAATSTNFPWMYADAFIDAASLAPLYYALVGVDGSLPLGDFLLDKLGLIGSTEDDPNSLLAGVEQASQTGANLRVARRDLTIRNGYFWEGRTSDQENGDLLLNPLGSLSGESQIIFSLPNQLSGYIIAANNNAVVSDSELTSDMAQNNLRNTAAISCLRCHGAGLLPVVDEIRPYVDLNRASFDNETFTEVMDKYPPADDFAQQLALDNAARRTALELLGIPETASDPIVTVYDAFDRDVTLAVAASDLGVTTDNLLANLPALDDQFAVLDNGTLDRDDFALFYGEALCRLQQASNNRPSAAICD